MKEGELERVLEKVEEELEKGDHEAAVKAGFWKAVAAVKHEPKLVEVYGGRIGELDRRLFESKAGVRLSYRLGTALELAGVLLGVILLYLGVTSTGVLSTASYILSALLLMTALHPIAHSIAGVLTGIRFHFYFLNGPMLIEPTLKMDYASYLHASPRQRSLLHLAGAVNSVAVTFLVFVVAVVDGDAGGASRIALAALWLFTTLSEILPPLLVKLNMPRLFFADFRKTDAWRALREWRASR